MIPRFRFWNIVEQKMYEVLSVHVMTGMVEVEGGKYFLVPQDGILMQSTGLLDKNGVEVFIGDIVRCSQGCLHEVIFIKEFGGMFVGGMPTIYLSDMSEGYAWTGDEEVTGNIWENPELVEDNE